MSIQSEITRIENAKSSIKSAIESKGVSVPANAKIDDYGDLVNQITQDGSGGETGGNLYINNLNSSQFDYIWVIYDSNKIYFRNYYVNNDFSNDKYIQNALLVIVAVYYLPVDVNGAHEELLNEIADYRFYYAFKITGECIINIPDSGGGSEN